MTDKRGLSESDICERFITPALERSGWQNTQWRREYSFTDGQIIVRGKLVGRGKRKRADYLLFHQPNLPIALIEAKDNTHQLGAGMQQGLGYATALDVPFVFSSNGDGFLFHDRTGTFEPVEQTLSLDEFPSPDELWAHYKQWKSLETVDETLITSPNYQDNTGKAPRYYQQVAINRTIEAISKCSDCGHAYEDWYRPSFNLPSTMPTSNRHPRPPVQSAASSVRLDHS